MQRLAALLVLGGALAAAPAFAQERLGNSQCAVAPPKFALSSANRVAGKALDGLFRGKAVEVLRPLDPNVNPRLRAWEKFMTWTWRADGSLHIRCEARFLGGAGKSDYERCHNFGPGGKGSDDVGAWRTDKDRLCFLRSRNNRQENDNCLFIHAQDGRYYAKYDGARRMSCLEGEIVFK